ncbi:MAG: septum formation initiator family protein [Acidobacteria bacterium]|nr:septum formation initiator family protein [Acidobacteriota bacterium]
MSLRKLGFLAVLTLSSVYVYLALRGPQGLPALQQRWTEIRRLQAQNAELSREVQLRSERIARLRDNPAEQELEIRKRLKLQRKNETTFITPESESDK